MRPMNLQPTVLVSALVALLVAPPARSADTAKSAKSASPAAAAPATKTEAKPAGATPATPAAPASAKDAAPAAKQPAAVGKAPPPASASVLATLRLPLLSDRYGSVPVAEVGDEVVTLRDLGDVLATSHGERKQSKAPAVGKGKDFQELLDRMIDIRLIVLEARDMGLDELPEIQESLATFRSNTLREVLRRRVVAGAKADPAKVEAYYKDSVREYRLLSLLFEKKEDAEALPKLLEGGKKLEDVAKQLLADKKAKGDGVPHDAVAARLLPAIRMAVEKLAPGQLSPPIGTPSGTVVARLDEIRYPESPEKRAEAEEAALRVAEGEIWVQFFRDLAQKNLKRDDKLLKSINFEAKKPGYAALLKDRRVVATIKGDKPVTVADVALEEAKGFFHGVDKAIEEKKVNEQKWKTFDKVIYQRLLDQEARRRKIADSEDYRREVEQYTRSALFGIFVQRVIVPDVQVDEAEARKYYDAHKADYTAPGFYKLESISFRDAKQAQRAFDGLKGGTDFKWLRNNSDEQITGDDRALVLEGTTYSVGGLPPDLVRALANASRGDLKLVSSGGQFHVVNVLDVIPPETKPYEEAKAEILKKLFDEHMTAAVKDWGAKLRKAHPTRIFVTSIED
ncbi:MAG TPA: peptidylprolyl isomerase [Anaeromyxobacter sp.]